MFGVILASIIFSVFIPWSFIIPLLSNIGFIVCVLYAFQYVYWVNSRRPAQREGDLRAQYLSVQPSAIMSSNLRNYKTNLAVQSERKNSTLPRMKNSSNSPLGDALVSLFNELIRKEISEPLFSGLSGPGVPKMRSNINLKQNGVQRRYVDKGFEDMQSNFNRKILSPKIDVAAEFLTDWFREQKRADVEQTLWVKALSSFHSHLKIYKRYRREVLKNAQPGVKRLSVVDPPQSNAKFSDNFRHLDEYNESHDENGETLRWDVDQATDSTQSEQSASGKSNIDEINSQIVLRMTTEGKLHPAVSGTQNDEMEYIRNRIDQIWRILDLTSAKSSNKQKSRPIEKVTDEHPGLHTSSRLLRILIREFLTCQFLYPFIQTISQPDFINLRLLQQAHKRLIEQKAVKLFRSFTQHIFTHFPPLFIERTKSSNNIETLVKFSKKCRSVIDVKAMRYLIVSELRKCLDDLKERSGQNNEDVDMLNRKVRNLNMLRVRYEKRLSTLTGTVTETKTLQDRFKRNFGQTLTSQDSKSFPIASLPVLTLRSCLEDYLDTAERREIENTTSVYFFMEYLEKYDNYKKNSVRVKFWIAAEKFRRLVKEMENKIIPVDKRQNFNIDGEVVGFTERLRKEAGRIYDHFLVGTPPILDLGDRFLLDSIRFFVNGTSNFGADEYFKERKDHECILLAQTLIERDLDTDLFQGFLHSESYFKWASEVQKKQLSNKDNLITEQVVTTNESLSPQRRNDDFGGNSGFLSAEDGRISMDADSLDRESQISSVIQRIYQELDHCGRYYIDSVASQKLRGADAAMRSDTVTDTQFFDLPIENEDLMDLRGKEGFFADDDQDYHSPNELAVKVTRLQRTKEEIDKVMLEIECLNMVVNLVQERNPFGSPFGALQTHIVDLTKELLRQEIGDLTRQKSRLESQEMKDAIVPGQCTVIIAENFESYQNKDDDGLGVGIGSKFVIYYSIEIKKPDHPGWKVTKRYNDFHSLHRALREKYPWVNDLELPGKAIVNLFNRKSDLKTARMAAFEKYLQRLLDNEKVCQSEELRSFLSTSSQPNRKVRRSNSTNQNDPKNSDGSKKTNKLSRIIKIKRSNSTSNSFRRRKQFQSINQPPIPDESEDDVAVPSETVPETTATAEPMEVEEEVESDEDDEWGDSTSESDSNESEPVQFHSNPLAEPLCAIMTELFEFKEQTSWLRRNAAVLLLKDWFGGKDSLGSHITQALKKGSSEETIVRYLTVFREKLSNRKIVPITPQPQWDFDSVRSSSPSHSARSASPGLMPKENTYEVGSSFFAKVFEDHAQRGYAEQFNTRNEAKLRITSTIPDAFIRSLGVEAATQGTGRLFDMFQHQALNKHIIYSLLDVLLSTVIQSENWS
ncbi:Intermediate filament protein [Nowakowskiella sp. JEL0407]|nr:Intermediate filament protein [Nowakowskiella sp. JEL0407]